MDSPTSTSSFAQYEYVLPPTASINPRRLTLTLPPLKSALKGHSKKYNSKVEVSIPKAPRPIKLKPLKEVLAKLISQIKKRDDYAFFLKPVDPALVPGYADVVKNPMDFGTMTLKVDRGRYRSLEDFLSDFCLVISNAKAFNPAGSLYHTEASRLEAWGLEHIKRSEAHVIAYETDWNIDVVADEEPTPVSTTANALQDGMDVVPEKLQGNIELDEGQSHRSPSVFSAPGVPFDRPRRGSKVPNKKNPGFVSESLDPNGRLPGSKDGLGAFPPESDMAALMLALKLKGKRYKTKKERLRMERGGPPYLTEGSLNYHEMEDPFSVLQSLVPDPPTLPNLTPVFPTYTPPDATPVDDSEQTPQPSSSMEHRPVTTAAPVAVPPDSLPILFPPVTRTSILPLGQTKKNLRHWKVHRNLPRNKPRDAQDEFELSTAPPPWKKPRLAVTTDYGVYSTLLGQVAAESRVKFADFQKFMGNGDDALEHLKRTLELDGLRPSHGVTRLLQRNEDSKSTQSQFQDEAISAEGYIRDIVYGGIDGLSYVRSIAEFVSGAPRSLEVKSEWDLSAHPGLGMPLAQWVENHIIDPLTAGHHALLRQSARVLSDPSSSEPLSVRTQLEDSSQATIDSVQHLANLKALTDPEEKIDLVPLLKAPHELFVAETEWAGASYKARKEQEREDMENEMAKRNAADFLAYAIESHRKGQLLDDKVLPTSKSTGAVRDTLEVIEHALNVGADTIIELSDRLGNATADDKNGLVAVDSDPEDPTLRKLRLNLLAVAKRAPLERIARLPPELVPPHIRHIVPTLSS